MRLVDSRLDDWSGVPSVFLPNAPINQSSNHRCDRRLGFTLVELMTVIAIIGILAGLILGIAGYASRKADRSKAMSDMEHIRNALEEFRLQYGKYPAVGDSDALTNAFTVTELTRLRNVAASNLNIGLQFEDPWGNGYWYCGESDFSYQLWSFGPDRRETNDNVDIRMSSL